MKRDAAPPLHLELVVAYTTTITALCALLAWRHHRDWILTQRISLLLLLTQARNASIDAPITMATGLPLLASPWLLLKPFAALAPITEVLLVLLVNLVL